MSKISKMKTIMLHKVKLLIVLFKADPMSAPTIEEVIINSTLLFSSFISAPRSLLVFISTPSIYPESKSCLPYLTHNTFLDPL